MLRWDMRSPVIAILVVVIGLALSCGKAAVEPGNPAVGGEATAIVAGSGGQSPASGAGGEHAAAAGQATVAGAGGSAAGSEPAGDAGAPANGGASGQLDCDPAKISCRRLAPPCAAGEVPSVIGSCYGECVKIERCACSAAEQCPEPNQYTCWAKQHCGPFVR